MRKQKKTIAKSLEQHRQTIGQPWDNHGKNIRKPVEKNIGQPWKNIRKPLENH